MGPLLRALRAAAIILDQELDVGILEFRQRHFGGILHRLRGDTGISRRRQRQNQAYLDLPRPNRKWLLLRAGRLRALRTELAEALLHARTCAEQGRAEEEAQRSPPGSPKIRRLGFERPHHHISFLDRPNRRDVHSPGIRRGRFRHIVDG